MDKSSRKSGQLSSVNVEFLRSQSVSKQAKVQEFWKYLDSQNDLKPYEVPKIVVEKDKLDVSRTSENSSSDASPGPKSSGTKPKQSKASREKKRSNTETCKLEKYLREDLRLADTVEVSYDELNAEIEDYQQRLLYSCKCERSNSK